MTRQCGTYAKYKLEGCRCYPCAAQVSNYNMRRKRAIAYGTWRPFMDAGPVREHVLRLQECGMGTRRIAELAGVNRKLVENLLRGKPGKPPTRRVRTENALRILALEPTPDNVAPSTLVNSAGTVRRLRALVTGGWSQSKLASRLGMTPSNFTTLMASQQVTAAKARKISSLYEELWDQAPPESSHGDKVAASRARNYAAVRGWLPPMAWDDALIDLPDAELKAELERLVALMDADELRRHMNARYRLKEMSPLTVAAARECERRLRDARREGAAA